MVDDACSTVTYSKVYPSQHGRGLWQVAGAMKPRNNRDKNLCRRITIASFLSGVWYQAPPFNLNPAHYTLYLPLQEGSSPSRWQVLCLGCGVKRLI